jgi:hypothetical protein
MKFKTKIILFLILIAVMAGLYFFFRYYFTYEQRNIVKRQIESVTGQNLTITVFGFDGKIIKRWTGIKKITSGKEGRDYIFFYTKDNKYVHIPNSLWYIAEEE